MSFLLTLLVVALATPFESKVEQAFAGVESSNWTAAAAALDQAYLEQPAAFAANNLHYLRGRVAENQSDWQRARNEFRKIEAGNPLYAAALWHAARASARLGDDAAALELLAQLPLNFPRELKLKLARESGGAVASKIFNDLSTRESRYERARAAGDIAALWNLIREDKDDDAALWAARIVAPLAATTSDQLEVGEVFALHRQFDDALPLYQKAALDPVSAADARFRIARIHLQKENYQLAIDHYRAIAADFPNTDWEKDSEYQIANSYWRLGDYKSTEKAYVAYIQKYGDAGMKEAATRNLVDVYRALGENQKALSTLDRALATKLTATNRQVFQFTKAKILYTMKRYSAALPLFQQLGRVRLRSGPGNATAEELQYFQALTLSQLGNRTAANTIWKKLAADPLSYYGRRSAEKLGRETSVTTASICRADSKALSARMESGVASLRHPVRETMDPAADPASELIFLRLWDEAVLWMDDSPPRAERRSSAQIAYLGGAFRRAISLANSLPKTGDTLPLLYPAGYRNVICDEASAHKTDPLWLHAIIWQESKYNPSTMSAAGARGLMQFIPETANAVATSIGMPSLALEDLYEPAVNIRLGAAYWSSLMKQFESPEMALAAYNGGPDNVARWRAKSADPELFVSDIGFVETKRYVMLVFGARAAYESLAR